MTSRDKEILTRGWYFTTSLLGCEPGHDINKRHLHRGPTRIGTFNNAGNEWHVWQDEALQRACDELNKLEGL